MAILPVGCCGSADAEASDETQPRTVPFLAVFLLRFHVALPYIFGGLAKIETDWLQGTPMRLMLMHRMGLDQDSVLLDVSTVCLAWTGCQERLWRLFSCGVDGPKMAAGSLPATRFVIVRLFTAAAGRKVKTPGLFMPDH
jgi:hypothetical protein